MFHDNTIVTLKELYIASQYKSARSRYCKECYAKGGNACQPCGWNRGSHLATGACPDSLHMCLVKTLEQQFFSRTSLGHDWIST